MPAPGLDEFQRALVLRLAGPARAGGAPALDGELLLRGLNVDRVSRYARMLEHKRISLVQRALPKSMLLLGRDAEPALHKYVSEAPWTARSEASLRFEAKQFREFLRANGQLLWPKPRHEMVVDGVTLEEACLRLATNPAAAVVARRMASLPTARTFDWANYVHRAANTRLLRFRHDVVPLHRPEYTGDPLGRQPTYVLVRKLPDQPRVGVHRLSFACWRFLRLADGSRPLCVLLEMCGVDVPPADSSVFGIAEDVLDTLQGLARAHAISVAPRPLE